MADLIQIRRDTAVNWEQVNPVLGLAEMGFILEPDGSTITNPLQFKVGNGTDHWNDLPLNSNGSSVVYLDAYFNVVQGDDEQAMLTYDHGDVTKARLEEIIGEGGIPCLNMYFNEAEEGDEPIWGYVGKAVFDGTFGTGYAFRMGNQFVYDIVILFYEDGQGGLIGTGNTTYTVLQGIITYTVESITDPIEEKIPEEASSSNKLADKAYVDTKYTKPSGGIPKGDLASGVQTELEHGQSAYGSVSTINEKIPDAASAQNKLVDKASMDYAIQMAEATYKGDYDSWDDVPYDYPVTPPNKNDFLVILDAKDYAPLYVSGNRYFEDEICSVEHHPGEPWDGYDLYKSIVNDNRNPMPPDPNYWVRVYENPKYAGTWLFRYVDDGGSYSKNNWKPEFKVSDVALTPEQMAALNSGITSGKIQSGTTSSNPLVNKDYVDGKVSSIEGMIPAQASAKNKLADKNFVNSTVQTGTANFRGSWADFTDVPVLDGSYPDDYAGRRTPTVNDYMVVLDTTLNGWQSGNNYSVDDIVSVLVRQGTDTYYYFVYRAKEYIFDSTTPPNEDDEHWELVSEYWDNAIRSGGTWRFKYSGLWSEAGVGGWLPEYQVNEEPLTAAQIAALNSNITAALTSKLQGLPSKPVDTAAQVLTDVEKLQARTNIGATAPEVFVATYGSTSFNDVYQAYQDGKTVFMQRGNNFYTLQAISSDAAYFSRFIADWSYVVQLLSNNTWTDAVTYKQEKQSNKVSSWSATPSDKKYPSEKLVYDSMFVKGVISQTQTWTQAADGGYDYVMSDPVWGDIPKANIDLYEAARATFNAATGYFELNGLTDISYEEMRAIYEMGKLPPPDTSYNFRLCGQHIRTNLPFGSFDSAGAFGRTSLNSFARDSFVEVIAFFKDFGSGCITDTSYVSTMEYAYYGGKYIKRISNAMSLPTSNQSLVNAFTNSNSLEDVRISGLMVNLSFPNSSRLSLASILYMIENEAATSAITITLHATAYARCQADTTEYEYGGQTYTGILAFASAKNITIASA